MEASNRGRNRGEIVLERVWNSWILAAMSGSDSILSRDLLWGEGTDVPPQSVYPFPELKESKAGETVYSRSSQSLIYLVEPLAAVVAPPYCRSCRCFKMGECHNLGTPAVTAFNLLLKTMIEKLLQKRDRESISCTLFFITRKFCCWRKVKVCSEGRGCLAVRSAPEEKMLRSLGRW